MFFSVIYRPSWQCTQELKFSYNVWLNRRCIFNADLLNNIVSVSSPKILAFHTPTNAIKSKRLHKAPRSRCWFFYLSIQPHRNGIHRHMTTRDLSRLFGVDSHSDGTTFFLILMLLKTSLWTKVLEQTRR